MGRALIVPAAGFGTRMASLTGGRAKELLEIGGRPAILWAMEEGAALGAELAVVVVRPGKEGIARLLTDLDAYRDAFPGSVERMVRLRDILPLYFVNQPAPRGEADAMLWAAEACPGLPLAVHYPDNVAPRGGALAALAEGAAPEEHVVGLMDPEGVPGVGDSGRVDLARSEDESRRITRFLPKGRGHFTPRFPGELRTCGIHLAGPDYPAYLDEAVRRHPEGEVTDSMVRRLMLAAGVTFRARRLPGPVYDVGTPEGYAACRAVYAQYRRGKEG
ncbi:sugar phosphate nucleotidyltransferase [Desulfohalovibrio reitneri]|uniref:sugar phosphate nucleotidyltransferase n=1 Tax=Desulfohalovibrio reitneri TaxID=1307759 RepID=UPI0004A705C2|nr:sugar phosphate nucleotidyltransferase [Desulfohalovibrio reitneri]